MSRIDRVRLLVRPDGWAAVEAAQPDEAQRQALFDALLAEYTDDRLVAAYLLELACQHLREQASQASASAKRVKVGPIEIERTQTLPAAAVQADSLCAHAAALRRESQGSGLQIQWALPLHVPRRDV